MSNINSLPIEILIYILEYVFWRDLLKLEAVSKIFKEVICNHTWRHQWVRIAGYQIEKLLKNHRFVSFDFTCMYPSDTDIIHLVNTLRSKNLKLEKLNLINCMTLSYKCLPYLSDCQVLFLDLLDNRLFPSDSDHSNMKYLSNCKKLDLSKSNIVDDDLQYLTNCTELNISHCKKITDNGLQYLQNCQKLNLNNCHITVTGLSHLTSCTDLNLSWCTNIAATIDQWPEIADKLKNLCRLNLTGLQLNDHVLGYFKNYAYLNLNWCTGITDIDVSQLECCVLKIDKYRCVSKKCIKKLKNKGMIVCHQL